MAAVGKRRMSPMACLEALDEAQRVFKASALEVEARIARCEAAGHLIDNLCAADALRLLQQNLSMAANDDLGLMVAERAKLALCWLELGDLQQALALVLDVLSALQSQPAGSESMALQLARVNALDVLVAVLLTAEHRLESSFNDSVMLSPSEAKAAGNVHGHDAALLGRALAASAGRDEVNLASLHLLLISLQDPASCLPAAQSLVTRLSAESEPAPAAWLRLALCFRLMGRPVLAAHCAREASAGSSALGTLRWQRMAALELGFIQREGGQDALGEVWSRLRTLEREARVFALWFRRSWGVTENRWGSPRDPSTAGFASPRSLHVAAARALLEREPARRWDVASLARACGVSRRTLEQAFRIEAAISVGTIIRQARIARALDLLRHTDVAVKRVAIEAGFASASSLCREVKRHTGLSPVVIRAREQALAVDRMSADRG